MKIRSIEAIPLQYAEPNDFNNTRYTLVVKIETDEGIVGWGESVVMWPEAVRATKIIIEEGFGPLLKQKDPLDIETLWTHMKRHTWWYGEGGIVSFAISGVDIALWDIKGKALGVPLYKLFGGKAWESLPACASTHPSKPTNAENAEELASYISRGFQSVKVGFGKKGYAELGKSRERDIDFVRSVRQAIGSNKGLMIDIGNSVSWDIPTAIRMTNEFEKYDIAWIEEPLHPDHWRGYAEIRRASRTLIATGERENTVNDYYRLIEAGFVDVVGIDPGRSEGITGFLKVQRLIERQGIKFNAHCWSTAITTAASLHLSIASPHCMLLELKPIPNPMQDELVTEPIHQHDGWITAIEKPGLGIEVLESVLEKYRMM